MAQFACVLKPTGLSKFTKEFEVSLGYVSSQSHTNVEHLVGKSQCLTCSCREVLVRGNKVESLAKIINIEIKDSFLLIFLLIPILLMV